MHHNLPHKCSVIYLAIPQFVVTKGNRKPLAILRFVGQTVYAFYFLETQYFQKNTLIYILTSSV